MPVLPAGDIKRLEFVEAHIAVWTANATSIGLTTAQVTAMDNGAKATRGAFNAQQAAKNAAKSATLNFHTAVESLMDLVRVAIVNIKNKAESTHDPAVYALAQIPPPAEPAPVGAPEAPTNFVADPNADGTVTLRWKGSTANQTFFAVWRRVGNDGAWLNIGATAAKRFIDDSVPGGVASVQYRATAQRQNFTSDPSVEATVNFGVGGPGESSAGFVGPMMGPAAEQAA